MYDNGIPQADADLSAAQTSATLRPVALHRTVSNGLRAEPGRARLARSAARKLCVLADARARLGGLLRRRRRLARPQAQREPTGVQHRPAGGRSAAGVQHGAWCRGVCRRPGGPRARLALGRAAHCLVCGTGLWRLHSPRTGGGTGSSGVLGWHGRQRRRQPPRRSSVWARPSGRQCRHRCEPAKVPGGRGSGRACRARGTTGAKPRQVRRCPRLRQVGYAQVTQVAAGSRRCEPSARCAAALPAGRGRRSAGSLRNSVRCWPAARRRLRAVRPSKRRQGRARGKALRLQLRRPRQRGHRCLCAPQQRCALLDWQSAVAVEACAVQQALCRPLSTRLAQAWACNRGQQLDTGAGGSPSRPWPRACLQREPGVVRETAVQLGYAPRCKLGEALHAGSLPQGSTLAGDHVRVGQQAGSADTLAPARCHSRGWPHTAGRQGAAAAARSERAPARRARGERWRWCRRWLRTSASTSWADRSCPVPRPESAAGASVHAAAACAWARHAAGR